ncbi:MAG: glutamate formimidoyltransferase [Edaphocola sp.]
MTNQPILECVPNFSEGQNEATITAINNAIQQVAGQKLLHVDASPAANRTVFTFAGSPDAVIDAAFEAIKIAAQKIDMRLQQGAHPRLGATDVCPLVPLYNMSMGEAVHYANLLAARVGAALDIPVFLYEYAAHHDYRRSLPQVRKGQYEGLCQKMGFSEWQPDYGPGLKQWQSIQKTGATIIGARNILVAFNVSLSTKDERIATAIAKRMRTSSGGLLPQLRAMGWYMDDFGCAQVSMNLLDYRVTSPTAVWDLCCSLAMEYGVQAIGCELVGLIPEACLLQAGQRLANTSADEVLDEEKKKQLVAAGIDYLKLDKVKPFDPQDKILEYNLAAKGII